MILMIADSWDFVEHVLHVFEGEECAGEETNTLTYIRSSFSDGNLFSHVLYARTCRILPFLLHFGSHVASAPIEWRRCMRICNVGGDMQCKMVG